MKWILYFISVFMLTLSITYPVEGREDFCEDDWNGGVYTNTLNQLVDYQGQIQNVAIQILNWESYLLHNPNDPNFVELTQKLALARIRYDELISMYDDVSEVFGYAQNDAAQGEYCEAIDTVESIAFLGGIDYIEEKLESTAWIFGSMDCLIGQCA